MVKRIHAGIFPSCSSAGTSSPQGRFVVTILGAMAQLEREQAAERTRVAMAELRRQGRRISGTPPFGYRFEGDYVAVVEAEQVLLKRMLGWQAEGFGPYKIARLLKEETGDHPRTGRPWYWGTVRVILERANRVGPESRPKTLSVWAHKPRSG